MAFKFQRFEMFGSSFAPKLSIRNNGQIGISQGALKKMGIMKDGRHVVLFYDPEARVIGIKPADSADEAGAIPIHVRPAVKGGSSNSVTAHISGRSFLDCYGIEYRDRTRSFVPEWSEEDKMFVVDLKKEKGGKRRLKDDAPDTDDDLVEDDDDAAAAGEKGGKDKGDEPF